MGNDALKATLSTTKKGEEPSNVTPCYVRSQALLGAGPSNKSRVPRLQPLRYQTVGARLVLPNSTKFGRETLATFSTVQPLAKYFI
jgi:hypothetical protein